MCCFMDAMYVHRSTINTEWHADSTHPTVLITIEELGRNGCWVSTQLSHSLLGILVSSNINLLIFNFLGVQDHLNLLLILFDLHIIHYCAITCALSYSKCEQLVHKQLETGLGDYPVTFICVESGLDSHHQMEKFVQLANVSSYSHLHNESS